MARRPLRSDEELLALARKLEARYGRVTVPALRSAAGGGSPNRLKRIIDAMEGDRERALADAAPAQPSMEDQNAPPQRQEIDTSTQGDAELEVVRLTARLEELQRSHDRLMELLREEREIRQNETETLGRLIERQNALIDNLGRLLELAIKTAQNDLNDRRKDFDDAAAKIKSKDRNGIEHHH